MHANGKTFDSIFYKIIVIIFIPFILKHRQRAGRSRERRGDIENQTSSYRRTVCQSRQKPNFQTPISPPYGGGESPPFKKHLCQCPQAYNQQGSVRGRLRPLKVYRKWKFDSGNNSEGPDVVLAAMKWMQLWSTQTQSPTFIQEVTKMLSIESSYVSISGCSQQWSQHTKLEGASTAVRTICNYLLLILYL